MTAYKVTYYTMSDGLGEMIIGAASPAEAEAIARQRDDLFAQLKQVQYIGDNKPMTTQTATPAQQAAEQFRADLRADLAEIMDELHSQRAELVNVRADLEAIRAGLTQAASQPAHTAGAFETMDAVKLIRTKSKGKWYYKMQGGQYMKQGVTIWDEILELLDLDPKTIQWSDEDTYKLPAPIRVKMQIKTYTDEDGIEKQTPQKVTGKA